MSQIEQVVSTLKKLLKQQSITYKALANQLDMSEANIKRMFSLSSFSLERLEEICEVLSISLTDLFALSQTQAELVSQLTEQQEEELLENPQLLLVALCIRDGWKFGEIIAHYNIDELLLVQLMAQLDRIKVIEFLPNNQYRSLIAQDFRWIPNGKLEQFMTQEVLVKFMNPKMGECWNFRFYLRGRYSETSIEIIQRRLNQLTREAAQLNTEDQALPLDKRRHYGLLMAMRPWEPSMFEQMRRKKASPED
ncbi:MAG: helix-turn-helix transcriptional regulator [Pseudomonadota bacterium]